MVMITPRTTDENSANNQDTMVTTTKMQWQQATMTKTQWQGEICVLHPFTYSSRRRDFAIGATSSLPTKYM